MEFSVIIPTYNRLQQLKVTLESVFKQNMSDYEVIVVDDESTDGTDGYLKSLMINNLKWITQNNQGPAAARNSGIKLAQGKYIAFTDDDCIVPTDWLSKFKNLFESTNADIIGGAVHNSVRKNIFSETSQQITNFFVEYLNKDGKQSPFLTSNNIAYRAEVLKKVGGFDERFKKAGGEERALNWKILCNGGKLIYAPDIVIEHNHVMNFKKFIRQQINYGKGAYVLYKVAGKEFQSLLKNIPFIAYIKLAYSLFKVNALNGILKFCIYFIAQAFVCYGYCLQALKNKIK